MSQMLTWCSASAIVLVLALPCSADDKPTNKPSPLDRLPGQPGELVASLSGHRLHVEAVAFSPDGKWLASSDSYGGVFLRDTAELEKPITLKKGTNVHPALWRNGPDSFRCLVFSPDSKVLAGGGFFPYVQLWRISDAKTLAESKITFDKDSSLFSLAFSPDGKTLATTGFLNGPAVRLWDLGGEKPRERAAFGHTRFFGGRVAFAPDGKSVAVVDAVDGPGKGLFEFPVGVATLWDPATGKERAKIEGFKDVVIWVAYSADSQMMAVAAGRIGGGEQSVYLFDLRCERPKQLAAEAGHEKGASFVAFLPDGKSVVSTGNDGSIIAWDISSGKLVPKNEWKSFTPATILHAALAPDGRHLAIACRHDTVQIFRLW